MRINVFGEGKGAYRPGVIFFFQTRGTAIAAQVSALQRPTAAVIASAGDLYLKVTCGGDYSMPRACVTDDFAARVGKTRKRPTYMYMYIYIICVVRILIW